MFQLTSVPTGAKVTQDGRLLGYTPLQIQVPRGPASSTFVFSMAGFRHQRLVLANGTDQTRTIVLRRHQRPRAPKPKTKLNKDDVKRLYDAYKKYRHWF